MFKLALLIHIASAIGLFVGIGLLLGAVIGLRRATTAGHAEVALATTSKVKLIFIPAMVLVALSGLYMMGQVAERHKPIGWIVVALLTFIAMGIISSVAGDKETRLLQKELVASKSKLSDSLRLKARDPRALMPLIYSLWLVIGILVLMVFQPGTVASIVVVAVALLAGYLQSRWLRATKK